MKPELLIWSRTMKQTTHKSSSNITWKLLNQYLMSPSWFILHCPFQHCDPFADAMTCMWATQEFLSIHQSPSVLLENLSIGHHISLARCNKGQSSNHTDMLGRRPKEERRRSGSRQKLQAFPSADFGKRRLFLQEDMWWQWKSEQSKKDWCKHTNPSQRWRIWESREWWKRERRL